MRPEADIQKRGPARRIQVQLSRTQLQLFSIMCYLCGLTAVSVVLISHPLPMYLLGWSWAPALLVGAISFAFGYFKEFRYHKDRVLDYFGGYFVVFVACRPILPLALTVWALYAVWNGDLENLDNAMIPFMIFLAYHAAEFFRMKQNGVMAAP